MKTQGVSLKANLNELTKSTLPPPHEEEDDGDPYAESADEEDEDINNNPDRSDRPDLPEPTAKKQKAEGDPKPPPIAE